MSSRGFRELNACVKDTRRVEHLFAFCYPSTYRAGMTGLATHLFYSLLNGRDDTSCERYFRFDVPAPDRSVETGRPLRDNHIVGFSLSYEEDILNLVQMLTLGGVTVEAKSRGEDEPIVLVGGPVVTANPEPYVDFVDAFAIGESEDVIHKIVDAVKESPSRAEALSRLGSLEGVYVPSQNPGTVRRLVIDDLDSAFHPTSQILPDVPKGDVHEPVFGRSLLVEVTRGCGHSCKFCLVGHVCRPRRTRTLECLQHIVEKGIIETPVKKVSLIGSSLGDMDQLTDFAIWLVEKGLELSVSSLRADAVTEDLLSAIIAGGQRTLTIAPETGSEELRRRMGKGLSDDDISHAVQTAWQAGFRQLKLYFIIGLPGETDADVVAIANMIKRFSTQTRARITASINAFVPKAGTQLEREPQAPIEVLRDKIRLIEGGLKNVPRVEIEVLDPRLARIQAALSIGNRGIGPVIKAAAGYGGLGGWRRAERETGIPFHETANDESRRSAELPWSFLK